MSFRWAGLAGLFSLLSVAACGRSQLDLSPVGLLPVVDAAALVAPPPAKTPDARVDAAPDRTADARVDRAPDLRPDAPVVVPPPPPPPPPPPVDAGPVCHPRPETCNGVDDDCNGTVDDGLPPIPCPNGGERYCISGSYSACPRRCEVCVPGSQRECFTTFCTSWGTQTCASDGRSFGPCKESKVPTACKAIAEQSMRSAALEQCCLDQGLCCRDEFDFNHDGDHDDMVGRCDSVTCDP